MQSANGVHGLYVHGSTRVSARASGALSVHSCELGKGTVYQLPKLQNVVSVEVQGPDDKTIYRKQLAGVGDGDRVGRPYGAG